MARPPKKIGDGEYRFDCECGRIHVFSTDGEEGKIKVETLEPRKTEEDANGKKIKDSNSGRGTSTPENGEGKGAKRKGFLAELGL